MTDFTGENLTGARFEDVYLTGARFHDVDLSGARFHLVDLTGAVIRFPWIGRRALAKRSPMRGRNVISGYLMYATVALGLTTYREILLHKPG